MLAAGGGLTRRASAALTCRYFLRKDTTEAKHSVGYEESQCSRSHIKDTYVGHTQKKGRPSPLILKNGQIDNKLFFFRVPLRRALV